MILPENLTQRLETIAEREGNTPEALLQALLDGYEQFTTTRESGSLEALMHVLNNDQQLKERALITLLFLTLGEKGSLKTLPQQSHNIEGQRTIEEEAIEQFIGAFDDDVTDMSTTVHETLRQMFADNDSST